MPWDNGRPTHVPTRIRDACLTRDNHQCTATQRNGTRCPETTNLEAAHLTQWREGEHITANDVRTLCHWHHNRETQQQAQAARKEAMKHKAPPTHPGETHPALR